MIEYLIIVHMDEYFFLFFFFFFFRKSQELIDSGALLSVRAMYTACKMILVNALRFSPFNDGHQSRMKLAIISWKSLAFE